MAGALEGITVLDLGEGYAAGYCTRLLAGLGADVIKVEAPGAGDPLRSIPPFKDDRPDVETAVAHLHLSMSKRSITLDPTGPSGQDLVRRLAALSDAVVETFRPGVIAGWGLAYEDLKVLKPDLIYASITPFGQTGPYAQYKGNELIDYSAGGYAYLTGLPDREPIKAGAALAEQQGGLHAAIGIATALCLRELTGEGDHLDVATTEAICFTHTGMPGYFSDGQVYKRVGARLLSEAPTSLYPSTVLPCKDGFMHVHSAPSEPSLLGVLTDTPRLGDPELWATPRGHADEIDALLTAWLSKHDKFEATRLAQELRHPFTPVLSPADLIDDPQFQSRDFFVELEHPVVGAFAHLGGPFVMSATPWRVQRAPLLGEHNLDVYCGLLGLSHADLHVLRSQGVI